MKFLLVIFLSFGLCLVNAQVRSIAIIGGGTAGLAAAEAIHTLDSLAQITIFEKEAVVGGNAYRVQLEHLGQQVSVDLGPQYFTEGPWDNYIALLEKYDLYGEDQFARFPASFTLADATNGSTVFCTPKDRKTREKWGRLLQFNRFYSAARKLYKSSDEPTNLTVGQWLDDLKLDAQFKEEIIAPFLSASLGVDHASIRSISAQEIVKLFAFRAALKKNTFNVFHTGMGGKMQQLAGKLMEEGVDIRTNSEVVSVDDIAPGLYLVTADGAEHLFDFVVFATHPDAVYNLVKGSPVFEQALPFLQELNYFQANIVLHRDAGLLASEDPSFLNILVDSTHTVVSSTMHLGVIDARYEGLYKSWLPEAKKAALKEAGLFVAERTFYHPLITPEFVANAERLQDIEKGLHLRGFAFAGGWTQGMETQETAVISGQKAAAAYQEYLRNMNNSK